MRARLQSAALVALGVAIGAFVAVPASHLIGHEDDHVHVGGSIVYVDPDDPEAVRRARGQASAPTEDGPSDSDRPGSGDEHGAGSLAHFGAAITASIAEPPDVAPRPREADASSVPASAEPEPPEQSGRRARAPPAP